MNNAKLEQKMKNYMDENDKPGYDKIVGIFKKNGLNTRLVGSVLQNVYYKDIDVLVETGGFCDIGNDTVSRFYAGISKILEDKAFILKSGAFYLEVPRHYGKTLIDARYKIWYRHEDRSPSGVHYSNIDGVFFDVCLRNENMR
jgi:hypothetical protein